MLRSTSYIAIELNVLHLKSYEIQFNQIRCAQAILPLIAFLGIDYYIFLLVSGLLAHEMSQDRYISQYKRFSLLSLTFVVVVCLFVVVVRFVFSFLKKERHFEFQSYVGA